MDTTPYPVETGTKIFWRGESRKEYMREVEEIVVNPAGIAVVHVVDMDGDSQGDWELDEFYETYRLAPVERTIDDMLPVTASQVRAMIDTSIKKAFSEYAVVRR